MSVGIRMKTCMPGNTLFILCRRPRFPNRRVFVAVTMLLIIWRELGIRRLIGRRIDARMSSRPISAPVCPRTCCRLVSVVVVRRKPARRSDVIVTAAASTVATARNQYTGARFYTAAGQRLSKNTGPRLCRPIKMHYNAKTDGIAGNIICSPVFMF